MTSAGRILIMPKGNYNAETEYEMLDLVSYNGTSWLAKKTTKGIEPSDANAEHWHNMLDFDPGSADISKTGDGTVKGAIANLEERKANGGFIRFTQNPEGKDYIIHTFDMPNRNDIIFFGDTIGTDVIFVSGVSVTAYTSTTVTVKFLLNQAFTGDVIFMAGYIQGE